MILTFNNLKKLDNPGYCYLVNLLMDNGVKLELAPITTARNEITFDVTGIAGVKRAAMCLIIDDIKNGFLLDELYDYALSNDFELLSDYVKSYSLCIESYEGEMTIIRAGR